MGRPAERTPGSTDRPTVTTPGATDQPTVSTLGSADLSARPMKLPALPSGAHCPVSPKVAVTAAPVGVKTAIPAYAFGSGPAYLSGQLDWYAGTPGQAAVILVDTTYSGPILIRAGSLDGSGTATLAIVDLPESHRLPGMTAPGTATAGGVQAQVPPPAYPGLWRDWTGHLTLSAPGCYAVQVDGTSFTSVVIFAVQPGPIPPG